MTEYEKRLLLLQITDSVFPIGAYSHSYGLETYVQEGTVSSAGEAEAYIRNYIRYALTYTELLAIRFAYERCEGGGLEPVFELEQQMNAARAAMEIRMAANKLAARFIKTVSGYLPHEQTDVWKAYAEGEMKDESGPGSSGISPKSSQGHQYAVAFGVFCSLAGIDRMDSMMAFAYSQISGMVVNCVKLIPLSQTAGQNMLSVLHKDIIKAVETAETCSERRFLQAAPGFELRGMQHEALYSRLYMS